MSISAEITGQGGAAPDVQSDGGAESFDFGSLREQALSMMEGTPQAEPGEQAAPITQEPEVPEATSETTTNVDTATQAQLAALKDTDLVEVEVDGQKVQMPWGEARGGVMRQAKFTKSMQQLAREREQFTTERETHKQSVERLTAEREALVTLLKNEQLMEQFLAKQYPNLLRAAQAAATPQQLASTDPDDIATVGQIEAVKREAAQQIQNLIQGFRQELQQSGERLTTEIEDRQASAKLGLEVNQTIKGLFSEHPYLEKVIPNAEDMLRYQVAMMKPQTEAEVIDAFKTVVGGWVENYKSTLVESNKQAVIAKHKLVQNNIQPPGGAPVQPKQESFMTKTRSGQTEIDWKKLNEVAKGMLS